MRIAILSSWTNGYLETLNEYLLTLDHIDSEIHYLDSTAFRLNSIGKIKNIGLKIVKGKSLRKIRRRDYLQGNLNKEYDKILVIRPEFMDNETHLWLKSLTKEYICYLFDGIKRFPSQKKLLKYFDKVFSYDSRDCSQYGFIFRTNFIPVKEKPEPINLESKTFYNISSYDNRFPKLLQIAKYLKSKNLEYDFTVVTNKIKSNPFIRIQKNHLNIDVVFKRMQEASFLVDIQRVKNTGLSFRIFEAIGLEKKLITDNEAVKRYDFYNPNNILVLDFSKSINMSDAFLKLPYVKIPEEIRQKYTIEGWAKSVFDI